MATNSHKPASFHALAALDCAIAAELAYRKGDNDASGQHAQDAAHAANLAWGSAEREETTEATESARCARWFAARAFAAAAGSPIDETPN